MATWKLSNYHKKNAVEIQYWERGGKSFTYSEGFRLGTFTCESDERPTIDLRNSDGYEPEADDEYDWELEELWDGCWGEFEFQGNWSDEEKEEIEQIWFEDSYSGLEEAGWYHDQTEIVIYGPLYLENIDTGESWNGEDTEERPLTDLTDEELEESLNELETELEIFEKTKKDSQ